MKNNCSTNNKHGHQIRRPQNLILIFKSSQQKYVYGRLNEKMRVKLGLLMACTFHQLFRVPHKYIFVWQPKYTLEIILRIILELNPLSQHKLFLVQFSV